MCKNKMHAPGCMRLDCWAWGVDKGSCEGGCVRYNATLKKSVRAEVVDCTIAPGVCCETCGSYWIPDDLADEVLAEMRADYEREMPPAALAPELVDRVFRHRVPAVAA